MPSLGLTRRAVDDIPFAASGQILYRDTLLSGFGLRVGSRSKVYFAEGQVNRGTRRVTIGRGRGQAGAAYVTRTRDPIITNDVLYQLS